MAAKTTVTTQVNGNTVTKKTIEVINPNRKMRGTKEKIRKAKLRAQHRWGWLCLAFTGVCFGLGATVLQGASTVGLLFLLPGIMLTFSKKYGKEVRQNERIFGSGRIHGIGKRDL